MRPCHFTPSFVSKHGHMLTLCSTEENKDFYQMLQSWQQDKQEEQMGRNGKAKAWCCWSYFFNNQYTLCSIKKGWSSFEVLIIYSPKKLSKNMLMVCLPKIYEKGWKNQFCFLMKVSRLAPLLSYLLTHKLKDEHIYQINYG